MRKIHAQYPYKEWDDCLDECHDLPLIKGMTDVMKKTYDRIKSQCKTYGELDEKLKELVRNICFYNPEYGKAIGRGLREIDKNEKDNLSIQTER